MADSIWRPNRLRVFISHLSDNKDDAIFLKQQLSKYAIRGFVAHADIELGSRWEDVIEDALRSCHSLIALLHPGFHESKWTDQEVGFVMGRKLPVFTIHLGETPYGFLSKFQAFRPKKPDLSDLAPALFRAYCKHQDTDSKMARYLAILFSESETYAKAKERFSYLEKTRIWSERLSEIVRDALKNNNQTIYVKDAVEKALVQWEREISE
jgi:hypothetical protein